MQAFARVCKEITLFGFEGAGKARHPFKAQRSGFEWKRRYNEMGEL